MLICKKVNPCLNFLIKKYKLLIFQLQALVFHLHGVGITGKQAIVPIGNNL